MRKSQGGSGRGQGRKQDWGKRPESRISVPYKLAQPESKKALVEFCLILEQAGLDLPDFVAVLKNHGMSLISQNKAHQPHNKTQLYRMYSTAVAASFGVISSSDADGGGYEEVNLISQLITTPDRTILLEVTGNSMIDEGIYPRSILVVETGNTADKSWLEPQNGNIVVALIDEVDLTVKRFRRTDRGDFLEPRNRSNKSYKPLLIAGSDDEPLEGHKVEIIGIVRKVIQNV
jgi:SOS-response transcriptional repressor LexA